MMCEQTGQEIDWEKCPEDWEDFPDCVLDAVNIFHSLGNRVYGDVGFVGKDYTNFDFLLKQFKVIEHLKDYIFELVIFMENRQVEITQRKLKAEYSKSKK